MHLNLTHVYHTDVHKYPTSLSYEIISKFIFFSILIVTPLPGNTTVSKSEYDIGDR